MHTISRTKEIVGAKVHSINNTSCSCSLALHQKGDCSSWELINIFVTSRFQLPQIDLKNKVCSL